MVIKKILFKEQVLFEKLESYLSHLDINVLSSDSNRSCTEDEE